MAAAAAASVSAFLTFLAGAAALAPPAPPPRLPLPDLVSFSGFETTTGGAGSVFLSLCLGAFVSAAAATVEEKIREIKVIFNF